MSPGEGDLNYSSSWGGTLGGSPSKYIISARPEKRNTVTKLMQPRGEGGAWELGGQGTEDTFSFLIQKEQWWKKQTFLTHSQVLEKIKRSHCRDQLRRSLLLW